MNHGMILALSFGSFLAVIGEEISQGDSFTGTIKPFETQNINFSETSGIKRINYFQCTGLADLAILDSSQSEVTTFTDFVTKTLGECVEAYACLEDPCSVSECPSAPYAECTSNYCQGCKAEYRVDNEIVNCEETDNDYTAIISVGAPPHKAILPLDSDQYKFMLRGRRSTLDMVNSYQIYVQDNSLVGDYVIDIYDQSEVFVSVEDQTINLRWTEPYNSDNLKHYCLYYLEKDLGEVLNGDWVACGHKIKENEEPVKCVNSNSASFENIAPNRSHYIWIVVFDMDNNPTAYPFVRVDIVPPPINRTLLLTYSIFLLFLTLLLHQNN